MADGATLQLGIGQIPDATLRALTARRKLAIWSEMISDGVMALIGGGARRRALDRVPFTFGSHELYEWVDRNQRVRMMRTETTNDPSRIAAHDGMVSVNSDRSDLDLYGMHAAIDFAARARAARSGSSRSRPWWSRCAATSTRPANSLGSSW